MRAKDDDGEPNDTSSVINATSVMLTVFPRAA
jgi:hypothetical protein